MKITAAILSIFISFLALKPGVDAVCSLLIDLQGTCCDTVCTPLSDKDSTNDQEPINDCSDGTCNPFQVCNSSVLLINQVVAIDNASKPASFLKASFTYRSAVTSQYISDFWQPPRFV